MSTRVQPVIILGFVIPPLCLLAILLSSIQLYHYTEQTFRQRLIILNDGQSLTNQLQSTVTERREIRAWKQTIQEGYDHSNIDGFLARLTDSPTKSPELASSSSINPASLAKLRPKSAQQLTLIGGVNSLLSALSHAESSYPAALLFQWTLKKAPKRAALQLDTQLVILTPPASASIASSGGLASKNVHAPLFVEAPTLLDPQSFDAFGLPINGQSQVRQVMRPLEPERPSITLAGLVTQLSLQGLSPNEEVIINTYLLHSGENIHLRFDSEKVDLFVREIRDNGVLLGWSKSNETCFLAFPGPARDVEVSTIDPTIFNPEEIVLSSSKPSSNRPATFYAQGLPPTNHLITTSGSKP